MIKIKKTINLGFLGEEYKDSYISVYAIPVKEYTKIQAEIGEIGEDNARASQYIVNMIKNNFCDSKIYNGKELQNITIDELEELPAEIFIHTLKELTGQISPND